MNEHDLSWADAHPGSGPFLGEIYSLAFVRGVAPLDALRRAGGLEDTLADRTPGEIAETHDYDDGYPEVVSAFGLGEWAVLVQPTGFSLTHVVDALSRGSEAVAVLRHDYASPNFTHAVHGTVTTWFNLNYPEQRGGEDPDRLLPLMLEAGFDHPDDDDDDDESWRLRYEEPVARALRLTSLITGVLPTFDQVTASLPSMHVDTWFSRTKPSRGSRSEVAALVTELGVGDTPGLADALAAADRGEPVVVAQDSDLGRHVREWSTLARRASWSLNDPGARYRLSDGERTRGHRFGQLVPALAAAFRSDLA